MNVGKAEMPIDLPHLVSVLRWRAENQSDRRAFMYVIGDGATEADRLSYSELDAKARAIGAFLTDRGATGKPVLLIFPPGLDFIGGFWGCLYSGAIAVPLAFPGPRGADGVLRRLEAVAADARPHCILTVAAADAGLTETFANAPVLRDLPRIWCDGVEKDYAERWRAPTLQSGSIACLQYTSGSTGTAKGVMISHGNFLANSSRSADGSRLSSESVLVTWAPTSHTAGLMYGVCLPICLGFPVVHLATQSFLEQPARWLRTISHFRATHAGGPNFCYDLCVQRVKPEQWREFRLENWQNAYSSGETVRAETFRRFAEAAAPSGFRAEAFQPCYGISETTMRVVESAAGRFPTVRIFDTRQLGLGRSVELGSGSNDAGTRGTEVIGYGSLERTHRKVRIIDPERLNACPDGEVGEVWIAGPDVALGYWNRPEESERTFHARLADDTATYLRTGDLGVVFKGELFLVGRLKELIIIRGANHFPQEIELDIEQSAARAGVQRVAAFGHDVAGEEVLVVVAEVERTSFAGAGDATAAIREIVSRKHGVQVYDVVLVPLGALPRTGSGKLQRRLCRTLYETNELEVIARATRRPALSTEAMQNSAPDLLQRVRCALAQRVGLPECEIGDRPFAEYGLDSVGAVSLVAELAEHLGRPLSTAVLFDYPTVDALVRYLVEGATDGDAAPRVAGRAGEVTGRIAIIGMGCRFPGGAGLENYWRVLRDGVDAVADVPASRWDADALYDPEPGVPGKTNSRAGGFIDGADLFDRDLFGMSERAAIDTDPQQRLLLEVAWETIEDAGIAPASLAGSTTGVFLGISQSDYGRLTLARVHDSSPFVSTGASPAIAANRLSYAFDLHGPSISIDTACSSSLVAVHQACRAIANGECDLAFAAGVNLLLTPERTIALSHGTFFSPDGKCKPFDASANGYVRGEGVGAVLLKPLDRALGDGDRIYAVVRGSAVNQDGKTNGLTAPNGLAQREVVRGALKRAGLRPGDVDYVEAHGTGTALGDPIEVEALGAVFTSDGPRPVPLAIGSVKSNIGHLEAAAGIAGLIKVALCLHRRMLVPTLHVKQLNPSIPFAKLQIAVPQRTEPWSAEFPRAAGISSFGFGGTNAHVVLEEPPEIRVSEEPDDRADVSSDSTRRRHVLVLSAANDDALRDLARQYVEHLAEASAEQLADICFTAATARSHLAHRLAVTGAMPAEMSEALRRFLEGGATAKLFSARVPPGSQPNIAFLFTGLGAQYVGMGRELHATQPTFRAAVDRCAAILANELEHPLTSVMFGEGVDGALIDQFTYMLPALFTFEYAMTELWRSLGIEPRVVLGHSFGELVAACVAGVFDLEDGLRLIAARGRLMQSLPPGGEMIAVSASLGHAEEAIRPYPAELAIAAINGPENVVISGAGARISETMARLEAECIKCTRLQISGATHSPLTEPMLDEFEAVASSVNFQPPRLAIISSMTGTLASASEVCSARYWRRHVRETVHFAQSVEALCASGCNIVIEVGPRPTLLGLAREILGEASGAWVPSAKKGRGEWEQLLTSFGTVHLHGGPIDWRAFYSGSNPRRVALPTYPFQHRRYWVANDRPPGGLSAAEAEGTSHPMLGSKFGVLGAFELDIANLPDFVGEHNVMGRVVFPGAGFVELALAAAREHWGPGSYQLRGASLMNAMVVSNEGRQPKDVLVQPNAAAWRLDNTPKGSFDSLAFIPHPEAEAPLAAGQVRIAVQAAGLNFHDVLDSLDMLPGDDRPLGREGAGIVTEVGPGVQGFAVGDLVMGLFPAAFGPVAIADAWMITGLPKGWSFAQGASVPITFLTAFYGLVDLAGLKARKRVLIHAAAGGVGTAAVQLARHLGAEVFATASRGKWPSLRAQGFDDAHLASSRDLDFEQHFLRTTGQQGMDVVLDCLAGDFVDASLRLLPRGGRFIEMGKTAIRDAVAVAAAHPGVVYRAFDLIEAGPVRLQEMLRELSVLFEDGTLRPPPITCWDIRRAPQAFRALAHAQHIGKLVLTLPPSLNPEGTVQITGGTGTLGGLVERTRHLHIEVMPEGDDVHQVRIFSGQRPAISGVAPVEHMRVELQRLDAPRGRVELEPLRSACLEAVPPAAHYKMLRALGLQHGRSFHCLRRIWRGNNEAFAEIEIDDSRRSEVGRYLVHPTMLDCGFQLSGVAQGGMHALAVPVGFERISYFAPFGERVFCHTKIREQNGPSIKSDVRFFDAKGRLLLDVEGYVKRVVRPEALIGISTEWSRWIWQQEWVQDTVAARSRRPSGAKARHWLILADSELGEAVARRLSTAGDACSIVLRGNGRARLDDGRYAASGASSEEFWQVAKAAPPNRPFTDIVHCWSIDAKSASEVGGWDNALLSSCRTALHLAQGILKHMDEGGAVARLWFVTRGGQPVTAAPLAPGQAPLWGFARVLRREHPELGCRVVDVDPESSIDTQVEALASELSAAVPDDRDSVDAEVAFRAGDRYTPRLTRFQPGAVAPERRIRSDAAYLVTGGLSGLGLATARWLVEQGARALVLVGRRGNTRESEPVLQWIEAQGATLLVRQADVSRTEDLARVLGEARQAMPALRGVIHCAGLLADRSVERQSWESFEEVFAAKIGGAWNLHLQTHSDPLDFFVLFSSNSALVGLAGQSNYAAANAFLDALAHYRKALGLAALSINWGPWAKVGLAARAGMAKERLAIEPEQGLQVLDGLLSVEPTLPQVVVPSTSSPKDSTVARRAAPASGLAERLARLPLAERVPALRELVRECVAAVASSALADIPDERPIMDLGLDSLMTVELRNKLSAAIGGQRLSSTFILKHPTVAAMAEQLANAVAASAPASADGGDRASSDERKASAAGLSNGHAGNGKAPGHAEGPAPAKTGAAAIGPAANVVLFPGNPSKTPLTLLHGIGGYGWAYLPLRQYIGDRPVVLVNKISTADTLDEYVPLLVETLRSQQPHGPYIVGGWSAGGRLAFEVAAQLESMGERVLGLVMFDVYRQASARRARFAALRLMMNSEPDHVELQDVHPIERLLTMFGAGIRLRSTEDVVQLARMVLPQVPVPSDVSRAGLAQAARWFLDQLAKGGRGLMLPDPTGEITEALETLLTIRRIYRMTMGKLQIQTKLSATALSVNVAGNEHSHGWGRNFLRQIQEFDVQIELGKAPGLTPFSRFAEHLALFDPENVRLFGPQVADFLAQIAGERPEMNAERAARGRPLPETTSKSINMR